MPLITWDDSIALNIGEIDSQHKQLVNIINDLFDAMMIVRSSEVIGDILNRLIDYTKYHFTTEEMYFDQFGYSESEEHKEEHKYFLEQVAVFKKAFDEGKTKLDDSDAPLAVDLFKFLKNWLVNHIQVSDKKYAPLFKGKGLQ
jgi:hemerythrin